MPVALTILAGIWRFADGRGWPAKTTVRNAIGLAIALACAASSVMSKVPPFFDVSAVTMSVCAILAWLTLIAGYTKWESWWSLVRYGGPTCAISVLGYLGGANPYMAILYGLSGCLVGVLYVTLHRFWPFRYSTAVCEAVAGAAIVGGLSWM